MKNRILFLWTIWLFFSGSASAQQLDQRQKEKFVIVPPESVLMTIASQPDSPLQFEEVRFLASVDGGGNSPAFHVRNIGSKPIRSFTIGGPDWTMTWSEDFTKKVLIPGERALATNDVEIVPLTDKLRANLKLDRPMAVLVVMVIEVQYADGAIYNARPTYQALQKYTERLMGLESSAKSK